MTMIELDNSMRRMKRRDRHSLPYRMVFGIPFHIYNFVLTELEYNFAPQCPWCGRQYFSSKKAKACCAAIKASRGEYPGMSYIGGGVYGAGSATYDRNRDCYHDYNTGATYTRNDR